MASSLYTLCLIPSTLTFSWINIVFAFRISKLYVCVIVYTRVVWLLFSMSILRHCWSSITRVWMLLTNGVLLPYMRRHRKDERSFAHFWWEWFSVIAITVAVELTDITHITNFLFCWYVLVITSVLNQHLQIVCQHLGITMAGDVKLARYSFCFCIYCVILLKSTGAQYMLL